MYRITNVEFIEYFSLAISKEKTLKYLLSFNCNYPGKLTLILKHGKKLEQNGPFIIPSVRWIDGYEYYAEFKIICDVTKI